MLSSACSSSQSCCISCWTLSKSALVHSTWLSWTQDRGLSHSACYHQQQASPGHVSPDIGLWATWQRKCSGGHVTGLHSAWYNQQAEPTTCLGSHRYTLKSPSREDLVSNIALELLPLRCSKMLLHTWKSEDWTTQYSVSPIAELCQGVKYFPDLGLLMHIQMQH